MFEKETKDSKYRENPYRAVNFSRDESGNLICPNGRKFKFKYERHITGNNYGRTEEIYECENKPFVRFIPFNNSISTFCLYTSIHTQQCPLYRTKIFQYCRCWLWFI